jgi:hypothetical protein
MISFLLPLTQWSINNDILQDGFTSKNEAVIIRKRPGMINYILLYKIRKKVKKIIKDKIEDEELATTEKSCVGCVADEISWEIYYLLKDSDRKHQTKKEAST